MDERERYGKGLEVLMQCAIYCGVPAANAAFRMAKEVFTEMDASK
jgi:3-oxoadipate enol-lactonase/4-carboxymuconolactone decarboxylase